MIQLTPAAAAAVKQLLAEEEAAGRGLRLQVVGGGCEGLYYDLALVSTPAETDEAFESEGVRLFVDRRALPLLEGTTVGIEHGIFRFDNPKAKQTCRCGASFR